jgi:hypothetical protein
MVAFGFCPGLKGRSYASFSGVEIAAVQPHPERQRPRWGG